MSESITSSPSQPLEVQHKAEFEETKFVEYIPLGSIAIKNIVGGGNKHDRETAIEGAQAVQTALEQNKRNAELGIDALTGLPTRKIFNEQFARHLKRAAEQPSTERRQNKTVLILADFNNLKLANDLDKKHSKGDLYLTTGSNALNEVSRPQDLLARIGGDELGELLEGISPDRLEDGTLDYDSPVRRLIEYRRKVANTAVGAIGLPEDVHPGLSFGYAIFDAEVDTMETMFDRADTMLYADKAIQKAPYTSV